MRAANQVQSPPSLARLRGGEALRETPLDAAFSYERLMSLAPRPEYGVTLALAGVMSASWRRFGLHCQPLYGFSAANTRRLLAEHFPGAAEMFAIDWRNFTTPDAFTEAIEMEDLVQMLVDHRTVQDEDSIWLAHALATGCLGSDHLWQDMNLPSRKVLSDLLHGFFTSLAARNRKDMKWKKFLYLQLCERAEIRVCKSPSCGVCVDYSVCFGPEA